MGTLGRHARRTVTVLLAWALLLAPTVAAADVTAFLGLTPTPSTRVARGISAGMGLVIVGFEFEGAQIAAAVDDGSPSLTTGSVNVLLQTPLEVSRVQFYATTGGTVYRESLERPVDPRRETHVGANLGAGLKMRIAGPLKLRVDYRVFRLRGTPLHPTYHRFYAGGTLGF